MNVLVAGGAGYIGSHTVKRLKEAGHSPIIYDNLSRGHREVEGILKVPCVFADLGDKAALLAALRKYKIDTVMHFAAYAYVGESVQHPTMYYHNNVAVTVNVLEAMHEAGVRKFIFSSSCATYGNPQRVPINEDQPQNPVSPYGRTKLMVEQMLADERLGNAGFCFAALRYFNASGCAMDGTLGEDHMPEPHLIPTVLLSALGAVPELTIFGTDYPTPDGTNIRDYIHVDDLADAHILAMEKLQPGEEMFLNLGTGSGFSVKQILATAEAVTGKKIPAKFGARRPGDAVALWADPSRAKAILGWEAKHKDPRSIIESAWRWFSKHPKGYAGE